MKRAIFGSILVAVCAALSPSTVDAALIVSGGNWVLNANEAGQVISIAIEGGDLVQGAVVNAELQGASPLPAITGGDIVNGTIFENNNTGAPGYDFSDPSVAYLEVGTQSGFEPGNGVLATLVISTVGLNSGTFTLSFLETEYGDSYLTTSAETVSFVDGSITVVAVPEPASAAVLMLVGAGLLSRRRRIATCLA
jgi:hypothetical protein